MCYVPFWTPQNANINRLPIVNPNAKPDKEMIDKPSKKGAASSPGIKKNAVIPDNIIGNARGRASPAGTNGNNASTPTITTMESGGIKITYEKQQVPAAISKNIPDDITGRVTWYV